MGIRALDRRVDANQLRNPGALARSTLGTMVAEVLVRSSQTRGGGRIEGHDDCGMIPRATSLIAAKLWLATTALRVEERFIRRPQTWP